MSGHPVSLSWDEFVMAAQVGLTRFATSQASNRNPATARARKSFLSVLLDDINGAAGELAYCKAFCTYWDGSVGRFHDAPDVPQHSAEIRTTPVPSGHLIVERQDVTAGRWFVLVTGEAPHYVIRGRIAGEQVKTATHAHPSTGGVPEWWVHQSYLEEPIPPRERRA